MNYPAPWTKVVEKDHVKLWAAHPTLGSVLVATVHTQWGTDHVDNIAAAPELLAITKALSDAINRLGIGPLAFLRQEAEEAIAKAGGRE